MDIQHRGGLRAACVTIEQFPVGESEAGPILGQRGNLFLSKRPRRSLEAIRRDNAESRHPATSVGGGDESTALDGVYALFPVTREILRRRCRSAMSFSKIAIPVMNQVVRPFTTKCILNPWRKPSATMRSVMSSGKTWRRSKATCETTTGSWHRSLGWKT